MWRVKLETMQKFKAFTEKSAYEADLNIQDLLTYEIANSWVCQWIWIDWVQNLWAKRMAKKVQRKHQRFIEFQSKLKEVHRW